MLRSVVDCTVSETAVMSTNPPIAFDDELRGLITNRLAMHDRLELPLEGRRHAAVTIMVTDSAIGADADDLYEFSDKEMGVIPGDTGGLDGRMTGVSGGASIRAVSAKCGPQHACLAVGVARRTAGRR